VSKIDAPLAKSVAAVSAAAPTNIPPQNPHTVQELKKKNHELEDQVRRSG
jgi:hypothetical protein